MGNFKILIIDDEPDLRMVLKMRLEASGYNIIEAKDGLDGLESARFNHPDLIILDVMMPKMDGYQVARLLKFDSHYKNIPIIMLSARASRDDILNGEKVGADYYITKPFQSKELLDDMEKLLRK